MQDKDSDVAGEPGRASASASARKNRPARRRHEEQREQSGAGKAEPVRASSCGKGLGLAAGHSRAGRQPCPLGDGGSRVKSEAKPTPEGRA
jgi:hypothetical protein